MIGGARYLVLRKEMIVAVFHFCIIRHVCYTPPCHVICLRAKNCQVKIDVIKLYVL